MLPRWTNPPERNTQEWIEAFRTTPRLSVVERIASDLSFAAGKLYRIDENGDEQELTQHPFLDFWANPNPLHEMSNAALWRLLEFISSSRARATSSWRNRPWASLWSCGRSPSIGCR